MGRCNPQLRGVDSMSIHSSPDPAARSLQAVAKAAITMFAEPSEFFARRDLQTRDIFRPQYSGASQVRWSIESTLSNSSLNRPEFFEKLLRKAVPSENSKKL